VPVGPLEVAGDEGQAVGQLETAAVLQRAVGANTCRANGRFVNQLQRQSRFDVLARPPGPTTEEIPRSQPQVLGHQQPQASQIAADLVGQHLPQATL
jgi:hypothetical protein